MARRGWGFGQDARIGLVERLQQIERRPGTLVLKGDVERDRGQGHEHACTKLVVVAGQRQGLLATALGVLRTARDPVQAGAQLERRRPHRRRLFPEQLVAEPLGLKRVPRARAPRRIGPTLPRKPTARPINHSV